MRGGHHEDAGVAEVAQRQAERDVPLLLVDRDDAHLRARSRGRVGGHEQRRENSVRFMRVNSIPSAGATRAGAGCEETGPV